MPPLPELDGVVFRLFRGESDYGHFARIITAFAKGEENDRVETAETIAAGYDHLERCDPKTGPAGRRGRRSTHRLRTRLVG